MVILIVYPFVRTVHLSFLSQKIYQSSGKWVGFANYTRMLGSADFWESFGLSIVWTVANVVGQTVFGIITALLLNRKFVGRTLARGLSLLPFFMPAVAMMLMWRWMLNDSYGIINSVLNTAQVYRSTHRLAEHHCTGHANGHLCVHLALYAFCHNECAFQNADHSAGTL